MTKIKMKVAPLENVNILKDKQTEFSSIGEMIITRAHEIPDKVHVSYYDQSITYRQMNERSNQVAAYLRKQGVKKGDVVSFMIPNSPEIYYCMFGTQKLGGIAGGINTMLKAPEILHVLNDSKPKAIFIGSQYMEEFTLAFEKADAKPLIIEVTGTAPSSSSLPATTMEKILTEYPADDILEDIKPEDPYLLLYSSGTTGKSKGIILSQQAELTMCKDVARLEIFDEGDCMLIILPMFHSNAICVWTYPLTYLGLRLCIRTSFSPPDFWPSIIDNQVTHMLAVPTMYAYVNSVIDPATVDLTKSKLRFAMTGAAPFPAEIRDTFLKNYGIEILEGYGLTEASGFSTGNLNVPVKFGSIGVGLPSQEISIMDKKGHLLGPDQHGEICIRGLATMSGYLNNPEATAETLKDGWLHTGDAGYMDAEGYVYMIGRTKEMINRGGENIYPREIELVLENHPGIQAAAVVGVPDPALGERVKACIIPKVQGSLTGDEIKKYLSDKIAKYKIPDYVEFRTEFAVNSSGKIMKYQMKNIPE
jgi:long-chain acyl-CoA synthetase